MAKQRRITVQQVQGALTRAGISSWNMASCTDAKPYTMILLDNRAGVIHFQGMSDNCLERDVQELAAYTALVAEFGPDAVYFKYPFMHVSGVSK